jgi:hypothetical protein
MCVVISSTTFVWNISHSKNNWARYDQKNIFGILVKYPLFLTDFNEMFLSWKVIKLSAPAEKNINVVTMMHGSNMDKYLDSF